MPWSEWQDPWLAPIDVAGSGKFYRWSESDILTDTSTDVAALAATAKANILAGSGSDGFSWGSSELLARTAAQIVAPDTQVNIGLGYSAVRFDGASGEGQLPSAPPPALSALSYGGIPADEITPYTRGSVDYESSDTTFEQWAAFHGAVTARFSMTASTSALVPASITLPLRLSTTTALAAHSGDATEGPDLPYASSDVLGDVDIVATGAPGYDGNYTTAVGGLDISSRPEAFTLLMQPRWLDPAVPVLTQPLTDGQRYELDVFAVGTGSSNTCRGLFLTPRWRYWIGAGGYWGVRLGVSGA